MTLKDKMIVIRILFVALLVVQSPYLFLLPSAAQTTPLLPAPGADLGFDNSGVQLSTGAGQTQNTVPNSPYVDARGQTTLIQQAAEQNTQQAITNTNDKLLQGSELAQYNDTYAGMKAFWGDDMIGNFFANIGQVIGRWLTEFINGWVSDTVQFLTAYLRTFVLNPNIAVNGLNQNPNGANGSNRNDDISPYIRQGAETMYGIAVDLLLLLFILCIWKYWADAAWRGGVGLMGSVGRLIFTAGLLIAWPTIYAFEIQITNEMIKAIYFNSADQVIMLDAAMAAAVKGGLVAGAAALVSTFAPIFTSFGGGVLAGGPGGVVLGTVGGAVASCALIIYMILGVTLIAELIYILILKAIQTALLTAQYMFAPIFLVFFATPDTENVCTGFVKAFVEVSLWTFVWVGLLKIMVILLFSDFNPWGKIILAIGVLQLMIQTPTFLARAQISPMSDFISAGLVTGGALKGFAALGNKLQKGGMSLFDHMYSGVLSARGPSQSQRVGLNGLPVTSSNPQLGQSLKDASSGKTKPGDTPLGPDGKPIQPPNGPKGGPAPPGKKGPEDKDKPVTDPVTGKELTTAEKEKAKKDAEAKAAKDAADALANKPGPKRPGQGGPTTPPTPTTPPITPQGQQLSTPGPQKPGQRGGATDGGTASGALSGATAGAIGNAAKAGAVAAGGAAALAALGTAAQLRRGTDDPSGEARRLEEARKQAEALLQGDQATPPGEKKLTEEDKQARAEAAAKAALQPVVKTTPEAPTPRTPEEEKKARAEAAALAALGAGAVVAARPTGAAGAKGDSTTSPTSPGAPRTEPIVTAGAPKVGGPVKPGQPTAAGGPLSPITPLDAAKAAAEAAKKTSPEGAKGVPPTQGQTLNMAPTDHDQEQSGREGVGSNGAGPTLKQPVQVRPILPGAFAPGPKRDPVSGGTAGRTVSTTNQSAGTGSGASTEKSTVVPELQTGSPVAGTGGPSRPPLPTEVKPPGGTPVAPGGKGVVPPGTERGASGTLSGSDTEMPSVDGTLFPGVDAQGRPVMVRVTGRPGALRTAVTRPGTVQGIVQGQPPLETPVSAPPQSTPVTAGPRPGASSVNPAASNTGTAAHLVGQSLSPAAVAQGRNIDPSTSYIPEQLQETVADQPPPGNPPQGPGQVPNMSPFDKYRQSNYRWVPPRNMAVDIRTAKGPTMGPSTDGQANIVGNGKGYVNHIRFGANATPEQKAMQIMVAGYAQTFSADSEAFDAAREAAIEAKEDGPQGFWERGAAGFMAYNGKSFKQTAVAKQRFQKSLLKHAVLGSEAYVNGSEGNAFTEYLKGRYGEMTPDQQAWGVHILTDDSSPESGWNPKITPATETLGQAGIPVTTAYRAAASNSSVLKQPAWGRGPAIRGVASYVNSIVSSKVGPDTHAMVKDAIIGREAPNVGASEVGACLAIMLESPTAEAGELICADTEMVQTVAQLVAGGHSRDYVSAYRSLRGMVRNVSSGPSGSRSTAQTMSMAAPSGSAVQQGGGATVAGFDSTGGGGDPGEQQTNFAVDVVQSAGAGNQQPIIPINAIPASQQRVQQIIDFNIRPGGQVGTSSASQSMSVNVGNQVSSGSPEVRIRGDAGSANNLIDEQFVDAFAQTGGAEPSASPTEMASVVQAAAANSRMGLHQAQQIIMDMHAAGFTDDQIQDQRIAHAAYEVYQHDASMLSTAAVTARLMGPGEFSLATTQVVQQMVDSGWSSNRISRPDVYTAQSIMESGEAPVPKYVQGLRMSPQYSPRPNSAVPAPIAAEAQRVRANATREDGPSAFEQFLNDLPGNSRY